MKSKLLLKLFLVSAFSFTALLVNSQKLTNSLQPNVSGSDLLLNNKTIVKLSSDEQVATNFNEAGNKTSSTNCTDKINYVGDPSQYFIQVGGAYTLSYYKITGAFQVYPDYKGTVTGVQFNAAKFVNNVNVYVAIFDVDIYGEPITTSQSNSQSVLITNQANTLYTATFSSPINVTSNNGFAVGFYTLGNQDSVKAFSGPQITSWNDNYGFISVAPNNNIWDFPSFTSSSYNLNVLLRPIVTTSVNPNWVSAKTSTGCGIPAVYAFTNTSIYNPPYLGSPIINPMGMTSVLDYDDSTPVLNNFNGTAVHSYASVGSYTPSFTQTYVGWTNNCVETKTIVVDVDNPSPSFIYNTSGLTVIFNNTSQNMTTYTWNFGDLSTSTETNPTHTFSSPGTYIVELEGTAPCGTVRYSVSITVSATTGINKNSMDLSGISLYPNPANTVINFSFKEEGELDSKIEIYNTLGALIKSNKTGFVSGKASVDISDLSKGMYLAKIKTSQGEVVKTFVKE